jgi:4-hydroxybenzoate polyprenyltransferase
VLLNLLKTMRPRQWTKNLLVYLPFVFTLKQYWQPFTPKMWELLAISTSAFLLFCVLSGIVYLINDLTDIEKDRQHPRKKFRPLASGALKPAQAITALVVMTIIVLPLSFALNVWFGVIAVAYIANNLLYSYKLKNEVILDVLSVSSGFVLRAVAGAAAIQVPASHWLFVCTALLSLFISFSKRRHELVLLDGAATNHRSVLKEYTPEVLDEMIAVTTASFVMAYSLYTFSAENLPSNRAMMLTIPFALYIVFRLLYLVHVKNEGGSPEEMVLRDRPLFTALVLWGLVSAAILFVFGK